jgi:hypothetical protein
MRVASIFLQLFFGKRHIAREPGELRARVAQHSRHRFVVVNSLENLALTL